MAAIRQTHNYGYGHNNIHKKLIDDDVISNFTTGGMPTKEGQEFIKIANKISNRQELTEDEKKLYEQLEELMGAIELM